MSSRPKNSGMTEFSSLEPSKFNHAALARQVLAKNDLLGKRIAEHARIDASAVPKALTEVVRFLNLIAYHKETLTPSKQVDEVWHEFILFTKLYIDFCTNHFGRIIHHHPGGTKEKNQAKFRNTIERYQTHFGTPEPYFWGRVVQDPAAECGACESVKEEA